jgi:hypothetical protein
MFHIETELENFGEGNIMQGNEHKKKHLKRPPQGARWGLKFLFYPKSYFFCDLKLNAKFQNPRTTPSGRKVCGTERKEEKKNNPKNSGHFVPLQRLRAAHALRSDQKDA